MDDNLEEDLKQLKKITEDIDGQLKDFIKLSADIELPLDYSVDSLDNLEQILLLFYEKDGFDNLEGDAWLYLGEVVNHNYGSHWEISEDKVVYDYNYGLPVVTGHTIYADEFNPMMVIDYFLKKKEAGYIRKKLEEQIT